MAVRIAIPEPTSTDLEYNGRSLPQYVNTMLRAAEPNTVVVPLSAPQERVAKMLAGVQGVLAYREAATTWIRNGTAKRDCQSAK